MADRGEQLWEIVKDAADHMTRRELQARIAALEAQLAERVKVDAGLLRRCQEILAWRTTGYLQGDGALRAKAEELSYIQGDVRAAEDATYLEAIQFISALEATPPATKVAEASKCLWTEKACTCGGCACEQVDFGIGGDE